MNTTLGDGGGDELIEFLIRLDGEEDVAGSDALVTSELAGMGGKIEEFSSQVLEEGGQVDGGSRTTALLLQEVELHTGVDATDGEGQVSEGGAGNGSLLATALATTRGLTLTTTGFTTLTFTLTFACCCFYW